MPKCTFGDQATVKKNQDTTKPANARESDRPQKGDPISFRVETKVDTSKSLSQSKPESKQIQRNKDVKKTMKKYPGFQEDVLKFTQSYFGNDGRKNAHYNLRKINRVNYNTGN